MAPFPPKSGSRSGKPGGANSSPKSPAARYNGGKDAGFDRGTSSRGSASSPWDAAPAPAAASGYKGDQRPGKDTNSRPAKIPGARPSYAPKPAAPAGPSLRESGQSGERIAKLLARAGVASRREVERMIAEGRVRQGDELVTTPAMLLTSLRGISVDGKPVKAPEGPRLFAFHKPQGLITAERDPAGRPTIYTALRNALPADVRRVMPVGRLDFNTEGLLMMTNDGELKRAMELPSSGIPRTYRARTFGTVTQEQLEDLIEGITIEGVHYGKIDANMERSTGHNQWIEMSITEGKNREVRRVLEHLGLEVSRLIRTAYGPFELLDLPRGAAVEIRQVEVERFRKTLKIPGTDAV